MAKAYADAGVNVEAGYDVELKIWLRRRLMTMF